MKYRALVLAQPRADLVLHGLVDAVRVPGVFDERARMLVFASHEESTWENAAFYPAGTSLPVKALVGVVTVTRTTSHRSPWLEADPTDDEIDDNDDSTILVIGERHHVRPQRVRRFPKQCAALDPSTHDLTPQPAATVPRLVLPEVEPVPGQIFALLPIASLRRIAADLDIDPLPTSDDGVRRRLVRFIGRDCEDAIGCLERDEAQLLWTRISGDEARRDVGDLQDRLITACGEADLRTTDERDDDLVIESDDDD